MAPTAEPEVGDLIEFFRGPYQHWAVYVGDGFVIHLTSIDKEGGGSPSFIEKAIVKKEKLEEVQGEDKDKWRVNNLLDNDYEPFSPEEILEKAERMLGQEQSYNVSEWNCKHFGTNLRYGKPESRQEPKVGDLIEFFRQPLGIHVYQHWAVYVGDGFVIHLTSVDKEGGGSPSFTEKAIVKKEKLEEVQGEDKDKWRVNNLLDNDYEPFSPEEILEKAERMLGQEQSYNVSEWNCKHFATNLRYGKPESPQEPKVGDLIEFFRQPLGIHVYQHWAVYVGDGFVIHLTSVDKEGDGSPSFMSARKGIVKKEMLEEVRREDKWRVNNLLDKNYEPFSPKEIKEKAERMLGKKQSYNVLKMNCEHFATNLRYGKPESRQACQAKKTMEKFRDSAAAAVLGGGGKDLLLK